ncbi:hypothetical protein LQZ19_14485 [Treponema primitia]|uniref:hypothetical protein n=1 Tax=Treponema primitia TaxID=88058 RepID=UPI0039807473
MEPKEKEPKENDDPLQNLDRELIFYYNRERRLERASPAVQALNEKRLVKGGFIHSLTSTKSHIFLLISILIVMAMIMIFSALQAPWGVITLKGNDLKISAGRSRDASFITINKSIAEGEENPYTGEAYVGVSPILKTSGKTNPADIPVFTGQIFFTMEPEEEYRLVLPFSAENYMLLFQVGDQRASTRVKTK